MVLKFTQPKLRISEVWCVYFLTESPDRRAGGGGVVAVGETTEAEQRAQP